jgi:thioesterase domain-containing protein
MIPAYLINVAEFPLNSSGKIDRAALPPPGPIQAATEHTAPATFIEAALVGMYATVLNREHIGAADSFFDIGGSSLAAMRLADMINKEIGVDVGVTTIFLHPAPYQLAASIDAIRSGAAPSARSGPLVELSKGTGELPLFLIHAVGGTVFAYAQLAHELAGPFRVYGLQAPGLTEPGAIATSLADLVSDYAERIRAVQRSGPYRLAGWSMGGVIAFEIARLLEQSGAEIGLLALLDAPFAMPDAHVSDQPLLAGRFLADAARSLGWDTADAPDPARSTVPQQLAWLAARLSADGDAQRLRQRFDVFGAHTQLLAGYRPTGPAVQAPTLIVSADGSPNRAAAQRWPSVLGGPVSTLHVDGDHYTFLRPPLVGEVGASMLKWHGAAAGQAAGDLRVGAR